jgi:hypothetical protein
VHDIGARTTAEPTRALVLADEYPGMLLPVAVFDPDRLAFLESVGGLAHRVRLAIPEPSDHSAERVGYLDREAPGIKLFLSERAASGIGLVGL